MELTSRTTQESSGFSLVELSIVLVILGLLTGGILAGQNLIRAAELRSVTTQFQNYQSAFMVFRDKYFALPGDMKNATDFWTSAGGTGSDSACFTAQTSSAATCNGDGNGKIQTENGVTDASRFTAWKHLANAGLIEGSYTGKTAGAVGTYGEEAGTNVPKSKIGNGDWNVSYRASGQSGAFSTAPSETNILHLNGINATSAILTPAEAWGIDKKMDDGSPATGSIFSPIKSHIYSTNCATSDLPDATYDVATDAILCKLNLKI